MQITQEHGYTDPSDVVVPSAGELQGWFDLHSSAEVSGSHDVLQPEESVAEPTGYVDQQGVLEANEAGNPEQRAIIASQWLGYFANKVEDNRDALFARDK